MRPGSIAAHGSCAATTPLTVGLPGAGKTTRAKELAATNRALRLTPDHWMVPLFGEPMADGKRFVLEGRLISVALQALRLGTSVVLDFGHRHGRASRNGQQTTGPWPSCTES
jgi:predicted kinase